MPTIKTSLLDIAYRDDGPAEAPVVLLLHGWPDDASTWDAVIPVLNAAGFRTIAPMIRGFGTTRFRASDTPRTGNTAMVALDAVALLDALDIGEFLVAGHDWGSSAAAALAVGWPARVGRIAMLSSPPQLGGRVMSSFRHARLQWYHWLQATRIGSETVRKDPKGFARIMWETWSPAGWFDDATFERVAVSFDNPDWIDVTLHSYRARWGEAEPDPAGTWLDEKLERTRTLALPALYFQGALDGVNPPEVSESLAGKFIGPFERIVMPGIGHFPTREASEDVGARLVRHFQAGM